MGSDDAFSAAVDAASSTPDRSGSKSPLIDASKPMIFLVGTLGEQYWAWVNQPEAGKPRFFSSNFVEACTKTAWWVVPLLWMPIFTYMLAYSSWVDGFDAPAMLSCVLSGIVAWQAFEYVIHRFVFHADLTSYWGITFHFLFHGCHHKYPMDGERLVFPPVPASILVGAVCALVAATFPKNCWLPFSAGMGYGYVFYDCMHYAIHHCSKGLRSIPILAELQSRHMHHHYRDHGRGYGISSTFFDAVLGTSA